MVAGGLYVHTEAIEPVFTDEQANACAADFAAYQEQSTNQEVSVQKKGPVLAYRAEALLAMCTAFGRACASRCERLLSHLWREHRAVPSGRAFLSQPSSVPAPDNGAHGIRLPLHQREHLGRQDDLLVPLGCVVHGQEHRVASIGFHSLYRVVRDIAVWIDGLHRRDSGVRAIGQSNQAGQRLVENRCWQYARSFLTFLHGYLRVVKEQWRNVRHGSIISQVRRESQPSLLRRRAMDVEKCGPITERIDLTGIVLQHGDKLVIYVGHAGGTKIQLVSPMDRALEAMREQAGEPEYWH